MELQFWSVVGMALGFPVIFGIAAIINGFALRILWGWFLVPIFTFPQISTVQAIGIVLIVNFLTRKLEEPNKEEKVDTIRVARFILTATINKALGALAVGWVIHQFI